MNIPTWRDVAHLHPFVRGFFTDDEMAEVTGAGSLAVTKAMQRKSLVQPSKYYADSGQMKRAWTPRDVARIAVVIELSEVTGLSQLACVQIIFALRAKRLDDALQLTELLEIIPSELRQLKSKAMEILSDGVPNNARNYVRTWSNSSKHAIGIIERKYLFFLDDTQPEGVEYLGMLVEDPNDRFRVTSPTNRQFREDWYQEKYRDRHQVFLARFGNRFFGSIPFVLNRKLGSP